MNTSIKSVPEEQFTNIVTPQFLVRVGGLPLTVIDELRFEQTAQWLDAVLSLESLLATSKEELVDVLHVAVNTHIEDQALRRKLINFKRSIFNMRLPGNYQADAQHVAQTLPQEASASLASWINLYIRYHELQKHGIEILQRELGQKRSRLKEIINTPDFRKGILLSSPVLDEAVDGYINADNLRLTREARTVEHSLLEYLFRTACKTSPFSTFTSVCFGAFEQNQGEDSDDIELLLPSMEKQSFTRLNMILLSRLSAQLLADPEIRQILPVRLTTGWRMQNGKVKYMRRKASSDDHEGQMAMALDVVQENIIQLPVGSLLRQLIELMGDGHEERLDELVAHLCVHDQLNGSQEEIERYLQHLLRLSFLIVPAFQLDIHKDRPLSAYRESLYSTGVPLLTQLADELGEIEQLVDACATASLSSRREILAQIREKLKNLGQPQTARVLPKTILYEDTAIKPMRLTVSSEKWHTLLQHISELQSILPVFDVALPDKLVMRGYFQGRYGPGERCDDFLAFADTYNQDFLQLQRREPMRAVGDGNDLRANENHFNLPELDTLNIARKEVAKYVERAYARLSSEESRELILDDDFLAAIATHTPHAFGSIQSHTFFSQFANIANDPLLVVNQIYSGMTLMFSRFAYCFADGPEASIAAKLRTTLRRLQPPGTVIAELKGGYEATNLNLHPIVTPYELVCPGEISMRPLDEQIPLDDLYIQDDEHHGQLRLYSKRLGKEVIPLYLGYLIPMALPEIQQILLNFSYLTMCPLDLWNGTTIAQQAGEHRYYPRLRYKNIVLQRATWKLLPTVLPQREPGQSDANFFLHVARWRKNLGLPAKVFISPDRSLPATDEKQSGGKKPAAQSYKPLYVDFENYFSVALLEALIRKAGTGLQVTEMLPDQDQLWFEHDGQHYVSEFVFEMNHVKGESNAQELD